MNRKTITLILALSIAAAPASLVSAEEFNGSYISQESSREFKAEKDSVIITKSNGSLETGEVEWKAVEGANGYNVYYKLENENNSAYKKLDNELIRKYSSYYRADALGLKEGRYVFKVVPIINNSEDTSKESVSNGINVKANTREGFAFSKESEMGTASGGYNDDGTVRSDTQIIYISAQNVNTVSLDVITNSKGKKTTCKGLADILAKRQKGYDKRPLIIRMIGEIKNTDIKGLNSKGYLQLKGCYNLTLEGVGKDATVYGWGLLIRDCHNVEVKNLGIMLFPDDAISLDTNNVNIWIHNNDIFYGTAGSDKDQAKGDGSTDVKAKSDYVTISYNHYYDSGKCSLCGMSDTENFHVTYHHNWFDHSDSRHPRIRVASVHVYNNYFDGNAKYGVGVTKGGSAFVENNYYRNCKYPMLISQQGTDIYDNSKGTFSGEAGGMIKAYNNKIEGEKRLVYAQNDARNFDAYLASSRYEKVPDTFKTVLGQNTYNNFDTDSTMYKYKPDSVENVKDIVTNYAGRVEGGDFKWKFTEADDSSAAVNSELMDKIKNYKSSLDLGANNNQFNSSNNIINNAVSNKPDTNGHNENIINNGSNAGLKVEAGQLRNTGMISNLSNADDSFFAGAVYAGCDGNSSNKGTYNSPLDLETALKKVEDGKASSVLLKSGVYKINHQITISKNGAGNAYNVLKGCKGSNVVLDFSQETYNSKNTSVNERGIQLNADYWYVGGITIKGAADNGMMLSGSHNVIEKCIFDANRDTGIQISRRSSSVTNFNEWPSYNSIINCTSRNNCDPASFENADGFAAKLTCGEGNVFDGCLSYNNSDDGWDLFAKKATGPIGVVTIRNCIAMRNGKTEDGTTRRSCDGNGFKLGGSGVGTPHVVTNCIAIENLHNGFTDNNNPSALKITNCTAFNNNVAGNKNNFSLYRCKDAVVSNCISYTENGSSDKFVNLTGDHMVFFNSKKWYKVTEMQAVDTGSSQKRGEVINSKPSASDFINASIPSVGTDFDKLWRNEDGTLNTKGSAIVSDSSQYAHFSSDGQVIGARLSDLNKLEVVNINFN